MNGISLFMIGAIPVAIWFFYKRGFKSGQQTRQEQRRFIRNYQFPESIQRKVKDKYPHLTNDNLGQVERGLREYFQMCHAAGNRFVSMPSQVVDVAWHEFILFTREYQEFCGKALGRFLHHTPAEAMRSPTLAQDGIRRAWLLSCTRAGINPQSPTRLPILFAIDTDLAIPDGFQYSLDCTKRGAQNASSYCASHIGSASCCGGTAGSCGGDGGGCGSGGCGGGCGGGG